MWVKICGLTNAADANWALECGADALGFVFEPASPRFVDRFDARRLPYEFKVLTVAVYGNLIQEETGCARRQYVNVGGLKSLDTDLRVVRSASDPVPANEFLLLDAHHPEAYGGTGTRVDLGFAAELVAQYTNRKIILAGGLSPDNVAETIAVVKPYGVDVSSGVESSPGVKDHAKIRAFIGAAKGG